ncbi:Pentatricopeptide repeat-containing protein At3g22690 [Linum grandiflorum]
MAAAIAPSPIPVSSASKTITIHNESTSPTTTAAYTSRRIQPFQNCKSMVEVKQLQSHITKTGRDQDPSSISSLVSSCVEIASYESLDYAHKALEIFVEDNGTTGSLPIFNSLIRRCSSLGFGVKAILVFKAMVLFGVSPDNFTFPFLLSGCAKSRAFNEGIQAHGALVKMGLCTDVFIQNSLIHFYGECGEIELMRKVFDEMTERNIVTWTSLIGCYVKRNLPGVAVDLFLEMVEMGIRPNPITLLCAISACAKLQDLELGNKVSKC